MKMKGFYLILLLAHLLKNTSAGINIYKEVDADEIPISNRVEEAAGTNLTLICKNFYSRSFTQDILWGWKRGNVQFNSVQDLEKMFQDDKMKLKQFAGEPGTNGIVRKFHPLYPQDSGLYFCIINHPPYYTDYAVVELEVIVKTDPDNIRNYQQAVNKSQAEFKFDSSKPRVSLPNFLCTSTMFTCNSRRSCIDYKYVCDGKNDCEDSSDENIYLCGKRPCYGKQKCLSGRCCCDKNVVDLNCVENGRISCCFQNHFDDAYQLTPSGSITSYVSSYMEDDTSSIIPLIISGVIIAIIIVLAIIFRKRLLNAVHTIRIRAFPPHNQPSSPAASIPPPAVPCAASNAAPDAGAEAQPLPNVNWNELKPPSYDQAVAGTQPSAPIFEKMMP